jgi:hypothetical protein
LLKIKEEHKIFDPTLLIEAEHFSCGKIMRKGQRKLEKIKIQGEGSNQKQSKEFPRVPHSYLICFGKCCHPFSYIGGPKGRKCTLSIRTFLIGEILHILIVVSDGPFKFDCQKIKK